MSDFFFFLWGGGGGGESGKSCLRRRVGQQKSSKPYFIFSTAQTDYPVRINILINDSPIVHV